MVPNRENGLPQPSNGPPSPDPNGTTGASGPGGRETRIKASLLEALDILRRGKWTLLATTVVFFALGAGYTLQMEREYRASSLVFVDTENMPALTQELEETGTDSPPLTKRNLASQTLILEQSLHIAQEAADHLKSIETLPDSDDPIPVLETWSADSTDESLAKLLQEDYVTVETVSDRAGAIRIGARSTEPEEASLIANVYAKAYVNRSEAWSRQQITASRRFLEHQIKSRRRELDSLESRLKAFMRRYGTVNPDAKTERVMTRSQELNTQLETARMEKQQKEATLQSLEERLEELKPSLADRVSSGIRNDIQTTRTRLSELRTLRDQIRRRNPDLEESPRKQAEVDSLDEEITRLERELEQLSGNYVNRFLEEEGSGGENEDALAYAADLKQRVTDLHMEISGLNARIRTLENQLQAYDDQVERLPELSIELARLRRDHASTEKLYSQLVDRLQDVRIAEESKMGFVEVARPADPPVAPAKPNVPKNLASALVLGLMFGVVAAVLREKLDTRVHTPDHLDRPTFRLLSVIPEMNRLSEGADESNMTLPRRPITPALVAARQPNSYAGEAYRRLWLNLRFNPSGAPVQTVLITSPEAGAGKSTTALNTAITTARTGRDTLLVDADLRRPVLHRYVGNDDRPDLPSLLSRDLESTAERELKTDVDHLYAVTTPSSIENPSRHLDSPAMKQFVQWAERRFDVVYFDSPPVLLTTDAMLIASLCDANVVVASAATTDEEALRQTFDELSRVGTPVMGTVLNRFDPTEIFGYDTTYGYRYTGYVKHYG